MWYSIGMKRARLVFVVLAVLTCSVATVAKESIQEQDHKAAGHDANGQSKQTNPPMTVPTEPTKGVPLQPPAPEERNKSVHENKTEADWWPRITNVVTAVGTIALAVIGAIAACIAIKTLRYIGVQTKHAGIAAKAARDGAQAVLDSERPWIVIDIEQERVPPRRCNFLVVNRGRTPAKIISGSATHVFAASPNDLEIPPIYESPFLFPNKTLIVQSDSFPVYPAGIRPQTMVVAGSTEILFFYGTVVYDDVFGTNRHGYVRHETRWCYAYLPDGHRFIRTGPDGSDEYNRNT